MTDGLYSNWRAYVRLHRHALRVPVEAHPAIWGDFLLRARTWPALLDAVRGLGRPPIIVETGSARDNGSTWLFHRLLMELGGSIHTVDLDPQLSEAMRRVAAEVDPDGRLHVHCGDSVAFLEAFEGPIDVLYLDSHDIDFTDPMPSMEHHRRELEAALPKLASTAIVAFDDTPKGPEFRAHWMDELDHFSLLLPRVPGKGTLAIERLRATPGLRAVELAHEYQAVFRVER
jgi:hypothetical protein